MSDSNLASTIQVRQKWPTRSTPAAKVKPTSTFRQFCFGTAVGVVVGAFCGAFLPDRLLGAGAVSFPEQPAATNSTLTRQNHTPTPMSELSDISASADQQHLWDADESN